MAIAYDATSKGVATATSLTYAHTVTGTNLSIALGVYMSTDDVTTVTFDGATMTQVNKVILQSPQANQATYLYYYLGPATGSRNIVISRNVSGDITGISSTYTGVSQSITSTPNNTNDVSGTHLTVAVT